MFDLYEYKQAQLLASWDAPFYAYIAAAVMKADTQNFTKLREMFPEVVEMLGKYYNTPNV